ncbi:MAG: transcription termination/antitermination protein NusG [Verrucomicrobiaceae bacterium]
MPTIPDPKNQWYVVHVLSGQEQKVKNRIDRLVEQEEMGDKIFEVLVPTELVSEVRGGKKTESKKKFFPGYVIVNMHLLTPANEVVEETWSFMQELDGSIGFAGTKNMPIPMRQREVDSMLGQIEEREGAVRPSIEFEVGDTVKVSDGPFESQSGIVEEIDPERGKLRVAVTIFGRSTPVELEYWQVEKG